MYICRVRPDFFPRVNLFHFTSVDKCIHFRRTTDEYIAFFIIKGDMYLRENHIHYHLKEGDWILLEPGKEHEGYKVSDHCTYFYIHFYMEGLSGMEMDDMALQELLTRNKMDALLGKNTTCDIILPKRYHSQSHMAYETILQLLNRGDQYYNGYKEFSHVQASCLLLDLFVHLSHLFSGEILTNDKKNIKRSTFVVYELLREINHNYADKFSSHLIESRFTCNFDYINRVFKKETGQTIFSYLTSVRIAQAKMLLTSGYFPVKTIARRVGYDDIYYFSNVFKKETGFSPTQYRKMMLETN